MDISSTSIKLVELSQISSDKYKVESFAIETLLPGVVVDAEIRDQDELVKSIKRALASLDSRAKSVAMGVPHSMVISKRIQVLSTTIGEDLEMTVNGEASKFLPFPITEVNLDYQVLGPSETQENYAEVLIAAVRKEQVDDKIALADLSGLKLHVLDNEMFSVHCAIDVIAPLRQHVDENIVYVDIGSEITTIDVFRNGEVIFTRDQSIGGGQLTIDIMRHYGIERIAADAIKCDEADAPADYVEAVLNPFIENLTQEVFRGIQLFSTSSHHSETHLFLLGGGSAAIRGLTSAISEKFGKPCIVANPFVGMDISADIDKDDLFSLSPLLMTACGLALRRFDGAAPVQKKIKKIDLGKDDANKQEVITNDSSRNLVTLALPKLNLLPYRETRTRESQRQMKVFAIAMACMGIAVCMLMHGVFSGYIDQQEQRNTFIKTENAKLDKDIEDIKRVNAEIQALLARKQIIESLQSDRAQTIQIMDQMVRSVPAGLYLKTIKQSGLKVNVNGFAISNDMVSKFMENIAQSLYLENPELVEIRATQINNKRLNEFTLNFSLKRPKVEIEKSAKFRSFKGDISGQAPASTSSTAGQSSAKKD